MSSARVPVLDRTRTPATRNVRASLATRYLVGRGIECGALQNPLGLAHPAHALYIDRLTEAQAREHYPELAGQALVRPDLVADLHRLPLRDGSVDFCVGNHLLEHARDPIGALLELLRVVRPGGVAFVSVPDARNPLDRLRPVTPFDHLLADHVPGLDRTVEDLAHYTEAADSSHTEMTPEERRRLVETWVARAFSIRFHTFDERSYRQLIDHVCSLTGARVEEFLRNSAPDLDEYIAILRRGSAATQSALRYDSRAAMDPPAGTSWAIVLAHVPPGAAVLDVGCSTGAFAVAMKRAGCHVTGVELDPAAAEIARTRCDVVHVGDIAMLLADGTLSAGAFDVVVVADVLEHLVDPWSVVRACRGLLRPGGFLLASLPNVTHASVILEMCRGRFPTRPEGLLDETHLRFFGEESALDLFRGAGYHATLVGRTRMDPRHTEFKTRLDDVPEAVLEFLDRNPSADTYQFIIRASLEPADVATGPVASTRVPVAPLRNRLVEEVTQVRSELRTYHEAALARIREADELRGQVGEYHAAAVERLRELSEVHARLGTYHESLTAALARLADVEQALHRTRRRLEDARARRERSIRTLAGRHVPPEALRVLYVADRTDAPFRYRCWHAVEQLRQAGSLANAMHLGDSRLLASVASYSVVVLFRLRWNAQVEALVERARAAGATLVYESDDLIFDVDVEPIVPFLADMPEALRHDYHEHFAQSAETFEACDVFIGSTPTLARHAERLGTSSLVHPNLVSPVYLRYARLLRLVRRVIDAPPTIAYLSGSNTHDRDLASIAGALATVLERHPAARLLICGFVNPPAELDPFRDRIVHLSYQDWRAYPWALARCHVSLAPAAIVNDFTNAKSALKFFEAGAFGVPTVATPTEAFREAIVDGENGFLAATESEWAEKIARALDRAASRAVGRRAYRTTLARYSFRANRGRLRDLLLPLAGAAPGPRPALLPTDVAGHGTPLTRWQRVQRRRALFERQVQLLRGRASSEDAGSAAWRYPLDAAALGDRVATTLPHHVPPWSAWIPTGDLERRPDGTFEAVGSDPIVVSPPVDLATADYRFLIVRMRVSSPLRPATAQLFWRPADAPGFSEAHSLCWPVHPDGQLRTYVLELAQTRWSATKRVTNLRFDPLAAPGTIEVETLSLVCDLAPRVA